ncbi:hypothetical protein PV-S19_0081 [Pacmanvirus S19]|nr:hypothetical protein PV-S19_0081 [Pacmanvirus S19]
MENTETTEVKNNETYGPNGHGEYLTPYESTIVFHPNSLFETTVAILSKRAQLIPITSEIDYNAIADSCEYLSPRVIIFGSEFPREALVKFIDRGFESVRIFTTDSKYTDVVESENAESIKGSFHPRIETFTHDNMYDHFVISEGVTPYYILEHVASGAFSNYQSVTPEINSETGKFFCQAILATNTPLYELYSNLCGSYKGIENINSLVIQGRTMQMERNRLANEILSKGVQFTLDYAPTAKIAEIKKINVYAVSGSELVNEMLSLAPVYPTVVNNNIQYVMFYSMCAVDGVFGWKVTIVTVGKEVGSALDMLKQFSESAGGTYGIAGAWIPTVSTTAAKLMPFIY